MELFERFVLGLSRCKLDTLFSAGKSAAVFAMPSFLAGIAPPRYPRENIFKAAVVFDGQDRIVTID
jgi:hypothetical protein